MSANGRDSLISISALEGRPLDFLTSAENSRAGYRAFAICCKRERVSAKYVPWEREEVGLGRGQKA